MAKAGLVAVPINFRLVGSEIRYIVGRCRGAGVHRPGRLLDRGRGDPADLSSSRTTTSTSAARRHRRGICRYETLIDRAAARSRPCRSLRGYVDNHVHLRDHRQTQGRHPQSREQCAPGADHGARRDSRATTRGCWSCRCFTPIRSTSRCSRTAAAPALVYDRKSFDPEHLAHDALGRQPTFTSLVPTHYIMMLGLPPGGRVRSGQRHETPDLLGAGPQGDEAGHHGAVPERSSWKGTARPRRAG